MAKAAPTSKQEPKKVHPVIQILVLVHLLVVISWTLPRVPSDIQDGTIKPEGINLVRRSGDWLLLGNDRFRQNRVSSTYLQFTGFWQYWDMFAPNPANTDLWLDAVVIYEDGTERVVTYPRMYDLPIGEKYLKERYRKFTERVNGDDFRAKWPHFAQRMAYLAWTDPENPPEQVNLRRHFKEWVEPFVDNNNDYTEVTFYRHAVNVSEIKEWKGW